MGRLLNKQGPIYMEMAEKAKQNITGSIAEYGKRLFGFIRSKVRNEEDAEDLLQDVWYQLSNVSNIEEIESVSGWLYRVARNKINDFYRKKRSGSLEDHTYENEDGELSFKDIMLADNSDPAMKLFKDLFWEELMAGLDELPANQREVFILNELEDMTLQEIAVMKNENLKTIISRKGYAVKYLRNHLSELYKEFNND
jgi:RNA polymerase sigma factor (sigma-70 family)